MSTTSPSAAAPEGEPAIMKQRANYLPAPHYFDLNLACVPLLAAFDGGVYLVGSCLERPDYRDVDVRAIVSDHEWVRLFGSDHGACSALWSVLCASVSLWLTSRSDLPIDFQVQRQSDANARYPGARSALGIAVAYAGGPDAG